jgi:hypothetical protein
MSEKFGPAALGLKMRSAGEKYLGQSLEAVGRGASCGKQFQAGRLSWKNITSTASLLQEFAPCMVRCFSLAWSKIQAI